MRVKTGGIKVRRMLTDGPIMYKVPKSSYLLTLVRTLMRRVPYPVVVITTSCWDAEQQKYVSHGMTVSSFNTVQIEPRALISFNVRIPSHTLSAITAQDPPGGWDNLATHGRFNVHVLENTVQAARLADVFTKGNDTHPFTEAEKAGAIIEYDSGNTPRIKDESVVAVLDCFLLPQKMITLDNHVVLVAEVHSVHQDDRQREREQMGLLYVNRAYAITVQSTTKSAAPKSLKPKTAMNDVPAPTLKFSGLPTIPKKADLQHMVELIRQWLLENPKLFKLNFKSLEILVRRSFECPPGHGIDITDIIRNLHPNLTHDSEEESSKWDASKFITDFHQILTKADVSNLVERVIKLFENDPSASTHPVSNILKACGARSQVPGLPSIQTLLGPLRERGLYKSGPPINDLLARPCLTLEAADAVESILRLRENEAPTEAGAHGDWKAIDAEFPGLDISVVCERAPGFRRNLDWIQRMVRDERLRNTAPPTDFVFAGELSREQWPRFLNYLLDSILADPDYHVYKSKHRLPSKQADMLQRYRISPSIVGFNYPFIFNKLSYVNANELQDRVEELRRDQLNAWEQEGIDVSGERLRVEPLPMKGRAEVTPSEDKEPRESLSSDALRELSRAGVMRSSMSQEFDRLMNDREGTDVAGEETEDSDATTDLQADQKSEESK